MAPALDTNARGTGSEVEKEKKPNMKRVALLNARGRFDLVIGDKPQPRTMHDPLVYDVAMDAMERTRDSVQRGCIGARYVAQAPVGDDAGVMDRDVTVFLYVSTYRFFVVLVGGAAAGLTRTTFDVARAALYRHLPDLFDSGQSLLHSDVNIGLLVRIGGDYFLHDCCAHDDYGVVARDVMGILETSASRLAVGWIQFVNHVVVPVDNPDHRVLAFIYATVSRYVVVVVHPVMCNGDISVDDEIVAAIVGMLPPRRRFSRPLVTEDVSVGLRRV